MDESVDDLTVSSAFKPPPRLVSVVIPNYNGGQTLGEQFEALANQTYQGPFEIVVGDNGSTDNSRELLEIWAERLDNLRWIDASQRRGQGYASNSAAFAAEGDYLVFCDADDVVDPGWIEALVEAAPTGDIVGGLLRDDLLNTEETRAWRPSLPRKLPVVSFGFLPYLPSGNLGVWAEVFKHLGGWNEEYLRGCLDDEFCWRAGLAGFTLAFTPKAVVQYRYRSGLRSLWRQWYSWGMDEPRLFRDFRQHGAPRSSVKGAMGVWFWLLAHLYYLWGTNEQKGKWLRKAANRAGRIRGSLHLRVLYL